MPVVSQKFFNKDYVVYSSLRVTSIYFYFQEPTFLKWKLFGIYFVVSCSVSKVIFKDVFNLLCALVLMITGECEDTISYLSNFFKLKMVDIRL